MAAFVPYFEQAAEEYGPELEEAAASFATAIAAGIAAIGAAIVSQDSGKPAEETKKADAEAKEAVTASDSAGQKMPDEDPDEPRQQCKQNKKLSKGEIKKLQDNGIDPHDLKPKYNGSRYDLFKTKDGDIVVLPKNGVGEPDPTGLNINDF
jgi:hypothetical protein